MRKESHTVELSIDGKSLKSTGKTISLKIDGELVWNFSPLPGSLEFGVNEFELLVTKFLLKSVDAAFGHVDRFKMVTDCSEQPRAFSEIKKSLKMTSPTLNYHLKRLIEAWVLYKNENEKYALTLLGQLVLDYFSRFHLEARKLKKHILDSS